MPLAPARRGDNDRRDRTNSQCMLVAVPRTARADWLSRSTPYVIANAARDLEHGAISRSLEADTLLRQVTSHGTR